MSNRIYPGLIFTAILFVVMMAFAGSSLKLPMTDRIGNIGPAFFPLVIASLAALLLLITLIIDSRNVQAEPSNTQGLKRTVLVFASLVLYILSLEPIGFIISTIGFIIIVSQIIRVFSISASKHHSDREVSIRGKMRSVAISAVIASVSTAAIHTTFTSGFGLILP